MILIPNYLNSQTTLVITKNLCYFVSSSQKDESSCKDFTRAKLNLLIKHNRWVSQVAMNYSLLSKIT